MENTTKEVFIYDDVTESLLLRVENQLHEANGADLEVRIHCLGGDVDYGFMIYDTLRRYAVKNKAHITTIAEGECASSATIFFLAGDKRLINENQRLYIHEAWYPQVGGTANELRKYADEAEQATLKVAKHYAKHTNLTLEQALGEMRKDNYLSNENAIKFRFAHAYDEILKPINKLKTSNMSKQKTSLLNKLKGMFKASNLLVYTASKQELDFYELEEGVAPAIGDKAKVNGQPAGDAFEDGKVLLPNGEVYVFVGEELTEIIPAEEVEEQLTPEEYEEVIEEAASTVNKLQNSLKKFKAENAYLKNKLSKYEKLENSLKTAPKETPSKGKKETKTDWLEVANKLKKNK